MLRCSIFDQSRSCDDCGNGGGGIEDFQIQFGNIGQAIAASSVSHRAVGHERDFTICDEVADFVTTLRSRELVVRDRRKCRTAYKMPHAVCKLPC